MASLKKKFSHKPMPTGAELFMRGKTRFARWTDGRGQKQTARVTTAMDGAARVVIESDVWYAKYTLASGATVERTTKTTDKDAALAVLRKYTAEQDRIRAGIMSVKETDTAKQGHRDYAETVKAFKDSMLARGCSKDCATEWDALLKADRRVDGLGALGRTEPRRIRHDPESIRRR